MQLHFVMLFEMQHTSAKRAKLVCNITGVQNMQETVLITAGGVVHHLMTGFPLET